MFIFNMIDNDVSFGTSEILTAYRTGQPEAGRMELGMKLYLVWTVEYLVTTVKSSRHTGQDNPWQDVWNLV